MKALLPLAATDGTGKNRNISTWLAEHKTLDFFVVMMTKIMDNGHECNGNVQNEDHIGDNKEDCNHLTCLLFVSTATGKENKRSV